jgi:hypothetical protein
MGQEGGRPERQKAKEQVPQRAYYFVLLADEQQSDQGQSER